MGKQNRRRFLIRSATAAGVLFVGVGDVAEASRGRELAWGSIVSIGPGTALRLRTRGGVLSVMVPARTELYRDGRAALSAFKPGDEVVVRGMRHPDHLEAELVSTMYRQSQGTLEAIGSSQVTVSGRRYAVTSTTQARSRNDLALIDLTKVEPGWNVDLLHRVEPAIANLVAVRIFV